MDIKEYISKVRKMPEAFVPDGRMDHYWYLLHGHLTTNRMNKMNYEQNEKFILYFTKWLWAWVRTRVDKNYELRSLYWHHIIEDVTDSESESRALFFELCDEFFQLNEETLQEIIDAADELDN